MDLQYTFSLVKKSQKNRRYKSRNPVPTTTLKKTSLRSSCVRCGVSSSRTMSLGRRAFIASLLLGWSSAAHLWTNDKISDCAKANREAAVPWLTASTVSVMRILTSPFLRFLPSRNLQPCLSDGIIIFFFLGFLHLHRSAVGRVV